MENFLKKIYYDLRSPAAYAGLGKVYAEAKKIHPEIRTSDVYEFLKKQRIYTMHKPARKKFQRLEIIASGLHTDWQCDLAIFDKLKDTNDGYQYLLVCIDVLSRKVFVAPVRTKRSKDMMIAFRKIFRKSKYIPWKLMSDRGVEFTSKEMRKFFRNYGILKFSVYTPNIHAALVERANRTIKERLYRYMFERQTYRWIDVVDQIIDAINNSVNRVTNMKPNDVNFENAEILLEKLYKDGNRPVTKRKYNIGDLVRIPIKKGAFAKGYFPTYSDEIFRIYAISNTKPPTYSLEDSDGHLVVRKFYAQELSATSDDTTYRIEKVLKTRIRNGLKDYFVKWRGYSDRHNSWINEKNIEGPLP